MGRGAQRARAACLAGAIALSTLSAGCAPTSPEAAIDDSRPAACRSIDTGGFGLEGIALDMAAIQHLLGQDPSFGGAFVGHGHQRCVALTTLDPSKVAAITDVVIAKDRLSVFAVQFSERQLRDAQDQIAILDLAMRRDGISMTSVELDTLTDRLIVRFDHGAGRARAYFARSIDVRMVRVAKGRPARAA